MPDRANTKHDSFEFRREMAGRYEVFLVEPRTRLGMLLGKPGNWLAEDPSGRTVSAFNTRSDGAHALLNVARLNQRLRPGGAS